MDKILEKFSLYDLLGHIFPGFLGVWALNIFFRDVFNATLNVGIDQGFVRSALFLGISYYGGVILHEVSEYLQKLYKKIWKGMPSERFLLDEDAKYSNDYKKSLKDMIVKKFNIVLDNTSKKNQEAFNLMYSEVNSVEKGSRAQLFNALYGMCRSFIAGTILCIGVFLTKSIITTIQFNFYQALSSYAYTVLFIIALLILSRRLKRFGERFADYVIRESYNNFRNK